MKKIVFLFLNVCFVYHTIVAAVYENLYVVGDACTAGWNPGAAPEMTQTADGVFEWTGALSDHSGNRRFKFLTTKSNWYPAITSQIATPGHTVVAPGEEIDVFVRENDQQGADNAFQVAETAEYHLIVNLNTMKMLVEKTGTVEKETPDLTQCYLVGSATPAKWDAGAAIEMTMAEEGVFSWEGYLSTGFNNSELKFLNARAWAESINAVGGHKHFETDIAYDLAYHDTDYKFFVDAAGCYHISVNLNTMKAVFTRLPDICEIPEACIKDSLKISFMGSSVCYGSGASGDKGYAWLYSNLLKERYGQGLGRNWTTSNISVGGNTTTDVLNRWASDLPNECSRYVLYGLSLGNERSGTTTENAFHTYQTGMLQLIAQAEEAGIIPVMANNYPNGAFNESDYNYVKQLNLLIHEWDVPSINTLGAIDDGAGRWAYGYENDASHPNTAGHEEFFYAIPPSLFDALDAEKPLPQLVETTGYELGKQLSLNRMEFVPENILHSFTLSFEIKTNSGGTVASFDTEVAAGFIEINSTGNVVYHSPENESITSTVFVTDNEPHRITLTHYYARGITMLYINSDKAGEIPEKLVPEKFVLGGADAPDRINYRQLFFWRAGMNADEISAVNSGKMLKSSLEIYAPLGGEEPLANLAQSTNTLKPEGTVSLPRQTTGSHRFLYPNPVKKGEKIRINDAGLLKIYSLGGVLLSREELLTEGSFVSTANLETGIYLIRLTGNNKTNQAILIIN
jgi:lysophospholipase L1-like esterase